MFRWNFRDFNFFLLPLVLSLSTTERSLALFFASSFQAFAHIGEISLTLPQAEQPQLSLPLLRQKMLQSLNYSVALHQQVHKSNSLRSFSLYALHKPHKNFKVLSKAEIRLKLR